MHTSKNTVTEARGRLYGNWGMPIGAFAILAVALLFLDGFLSFCSAMFPFPLPLKAAGFTLSILLFAFMLAPLFYGIENWFYALSGGYSLPAESLLTFYRTPFRTLQFFLLSGTPKLLLTILCFGPGISLIVLSQSGYVPEFIPESVVWLTAAVLTVIGAAVWLYTVLGMFLADFYFFQFPDLSPRQCCVLSRQHMKGNRFSVLDIIVSLSGWLFLCLAVLPMLYTLPLVCESFSLAARRIILEKSTHICYNINESVAEKQKEFV